MKMKKAGYLALAVVALFAAPAHAQMTWTDQGFVNVSFGVQAGSDSLQTTSGFDLYGEQGTLATTQDIDGGAIFDIGGGYKVWRNLAVGISFSRVKSDSDINITATVPDPNFFDRQRAVAGNAPGADHSEFATHLQATWMMPVTDKIDVGLSFGPTIFSVSQEVATAITVNEPGPSLASTTIVKAKETGVGINLGADVTYLVTPRFGAGVLLRYTHGSVDVPGATDSLAVGGVQFGVGLRVRF